MRLVPRTLCVFLLLASCAEPGVNLDADGGATGADGAGGSDGAGGDDASGPAPDALPPNVDRPGNDTRDSDCDGLSDEEEFGIVWPDGSRTDPANPDSDGDGLLDGLEVGRTASVDPNCAAFVGDADPNSRTDPTRADSDGDGVPDGTEDADHDGAVGAGRETDPRNPDSDGDGFCDGIIDIPGVCTGGDPTPIPGGIDSDGDGLPDLIDPDALRPDTDGDGLCDGPLSVMGVCIGGEDLDADGQQGVGETNPRSIDTDCDGLVDGQSYGGFLGERTLGTSPTDPDTDGDGIFDGLEAGVTTAPDPSCAAVPLDADPSTTTSPTRADTDGDGIPDGAEDSNQDGRLDPGELNPNDAADGMSDPSVVAACSADRLIPVDRARSFAADIQVVTASRAADQFGETTELTAPGGRVVGRMGFHASAEVAYVVLTSTPAAADALAEELARRAVLERVGALTTPITRRTTTWDGYPAVTATYDMAGRQGVKVRANAVARALSPGVGGLLPTANDAMARDYVVHATYVIRSPRTAVTLIAIAPAARRGSFVLADLGGGAGLGQFADTLGVSCDRFVAQPNANLDVLWAVDNSVSMAQEQGAVAASAAALEARLSGASVDWRTSVVTSAFYAPPRATCGNSVCDDATTTQCRPFTNDIARFTRWFTSTSTNWIGAGGTCNLANEQITWSAQLLLTARMMGDTRAAFVPPLAMPGDDRLRADTNLVIIMMGDADDQHYSNAQAPAGIDAYEAFFRGLPVRSVTMGGILCPIGETCGETQRMPLVARSLVDRFGGVIGSINDVASIAPTVSAIIDAALGAVSPYVLSKSPIPSTIRVALEPGSTVGMCAVGDVPRSRQDGFDYDPDRRAILFFGNCRPASGRPSRIAVSYRSWNDVSPTPDPAACTSCGGCPGFAICDTSACACSCEQQLSCGPGLRWDAAACDCVCDATSLGCDATHMADPNLCACVCTPGCGGCGAGTICQQSACACRPLGV